MTFTLRGKSSKVPESLLISNCSLKIFKVPSHFCTSNLPLAQPWVIGQWWSLRQNLSGWIVEGFLHNLFDIKLLCTLNQFSIDASNLSDFSGYNGCNQTDSCM